MKTTTGILFILMLFSTAVPSMLFSSEKLSTEDPLEDQISKLFQFELLANAGELSTESINVYKFIAYKANINPTGSLLVHAVRQGSIGVIEMILMYNNSVNDGVDIDKQDSSGYSPLKWAVLRKDPNIIKLVLQRKADINGTGSDGYSVLGLAAFQRDPEITKLLLENNADPNKNDKDGKCRSPLQIAELKKYPELVELLRGSEPDRESKLSDTE